MKKKKVIVVATRNAGKLREIEDMLDLGGWRIVNMSKFPEIGEIPEDADTFEGNARIKASTVAAATGVVALADDSGIEVDAIGGKPGVNSARFAGENATDDMNNEKLLEKMEGVPYEKRTARFVSVICVRTPDGEELSVRGECEGVILEEYRGTYGFGYDPLFYHAPSGKTFSEMTPEEKNAVSHRRMALEKLKRELSVFLDRHFLN